MNSPLTTKVIQLTGDPGEHFYQLGVREKEAFLTLEKRIKKSFAIHPFVREGKNVLAKFQEFYPKRTSSFFAKCVSNYAEGLGISSGRYFSFLFLLEHSQFSGFPKVGAHGCMSFLYQKEGELHHLRLMDFPLIDFFEQHSRFYLWKFPHRPSLLTLSCEGLAPVFFSRCSSSRFQFCLS